MQPQDNDFPLDQIKSTPSTGSDGGSLAGGTTFQPQVSGQPHEQSGQVAQPQPQPQPTAQPTAQPNQPVGQQPTAPDWQQDAINDASELYGQPQPPSQPGIGQANNSTVPPPAPPGSDQDPNTSIASMQQDFTQANNLASPSPVVAPDSANIHPPAGIPQPNAPVQSPNDQGASFADVNTPNTAVTPAPGVDPAVAPAPQPTPIEPISHGDSATPPASPLGESGLPGASQLGTAAVGMDHTASVPPQPHLDPNLAGINPLTAGMDNGGAYGPPPGNKKKLMFIIGGAVVGLVLIIIIVMVIANNSARKPAQTLNPSAPTPTPQPAPETQKEVQTDPSSPSGPATPPQGYITIEKQCYSFALYDPNTVPTDKSCSFKDATFGKLKNSKISVVTITEAYKNLDEFIGVIRPTVTVIGEESLKLDNMDAKQLIYKASDGKTYSKVLALIVGKNYQQDGKPVTGIEITTSYQDDFPKTVTKNVLDTWRWK